MLTRRHFLHGAGAGALALGSLALLPTWARPASAGNTGLTTLTGTRFDLNIGRFPVRIGGRAAMALGMNGQMPGPLIRFREGDEVTINVTNTLDEDTSIHWHGLLVPFHMDGVPGVSFPGIRPGETFTYRYAVPQHGTYWYHSHSGLQEQIGHLGPLVIDPRGTDPVGYDREYVLVLSDWSFEDPHRIFRKLKAKSDTYNFEHPTLPGFVDEAQSRGLGDAIERRAMWGTMRMMPTDIADVTGATYTFLVNGHSTEDAWNAVYRPGERVRLRIINASAMTIFNFRIPGLPMTVVQADGLDVQPVDTDEFQIGVAETYDVVVQPREARAWPIVAESIDRSGQVVATLAPRVGMRAEAPPLRTPPVLTMKDMGHGGMAMSGDGMDHGSMDHGGMHHGGMDHGAGTQAHPHPVGPGVDSVATHPVNRLDEPGLGLEGVPHRALTYAQLRSLEPNPDTRPPERELEIHLTGNMERYMWAFDGVEFAHISGPIEFHEGERLRMTLVNDTMMSHPIHLHGMYFDVVNGSDTHKPRKHTIIVKPGEKLSVDISAEHVGDWAFHCHLLYHMHAGMMNVVSLLPQGHPRHRRAAPGEDGHGRHRDHGDGQGLDPGAHDHHGHGGDA